MMQLVPYTADWLGQISQLAILPHQQPFIGDLPALLQSLGNQGLSGHVMAQDNTAVGFFRLDECFASSHPFAPANAIGLRSFLVGKDFQGQGYAKQALLALPAYLQAQGLSTGDLYLTVNCKNTSAYQLYLHCGFVDTGELYLGGGYGPQHAMVLARNP